jgi:hypothetical protein
MQEKQPFFMHSLHMGYIYILQFSSRQDVMLIASIRATRKKANYKSMPPQSWKNRILETLASRFPLWFVEVKGLDRRYI